VKTRLDTQGIDVVASAGAQLDRLVSQEIKLFTQVVRDQGIKTE
jgi:hypothetical protein